MNFEGVRDYFRVLFFDFLFQVIQFSFSHQLIFALFLSLRTLFFFFQLVHVQCVLALIFSHGQYVHVQDVLVHVFQLFLFQYVGVQVLFREQYVHVQDALVQVFQPFLFQYVDVQDALLLLFQQHDVFAFQQFFVV